MKKALFILVAVALSVTAFAQKGLHVGIVGGPQSTWLFNKQDSDDPNRYEGGVRGFVGATVDYHFTPKLGAGIELVYSWQGQDYRTPSPANVKYKITANYLKIPILLNFNSNPEHVAMFIGKFGPVLAINTADKFHTDLPAPYDVKDIKSDFQKLNVGAMLGLGIGFNVTKSFVISAQLRLDGGITDALNKNYDYFATDSKGERGRTWNVAGGIEIGAKYIIPMGGSKTTYKKTTTTTKKTTTTTKKK